MRLKLWQPLLFVVWLSREENKEGGQDFERLGDLSNNTFLLYSLARLIDKYTSSYRTG